jgi:hypothetical protein
MKKIQLIGLTLLSMSLVCSPGQGATNAQPNQVPEKLAATPPMGWISYNAFGDSVTEEEVLANAEYMKAKLLPYGWNYVVIDFRWYDPVTTLNDHNLTRDRMGAPLAADFYGRMMPASEKFPLPSAAWASNRWQTESTAWGSSSAFT